MSLEEKNRRIQISVPSFGDEEYEAVKKPLASGWITQGKFVREFEENFADIHQVKYAIATTSCTTALHLMLLAGGIKEGDEVIVPSFTWIATANAVKYCGATPVFADIDLATFNISLEDTLKKITKKTKAVIVVHLFGLCVDVEQFRNKLPETIKIFEDAACAAGASVQRKMAGGIGDAASFSFHPRKSITTGEGGMLTTNDEKLADIARKMRNHGAEISEEERHSGPAPYLLPDFKLLGFNYRMTDLQAVIGIEQLKKLDRFIQERNLLADKYSEALKECNWMNLPVTSQGCRHAWQAYVVRVNTSLGREFRNKVMKELGSKGISARPGTHAIHQLEVYKRSGHNIGFLTNSEIAADTSMAIPIHNNLSELDQDRVIETLLSIEI